MVLKRIYIVGPSGSGKTTLGRLLSEKLNVPHIDLDHIAYPNQIENPLSERLKHIASLAKEDHWVTEGIYVDWTTELFKKSDLIIWLDLSLRKTFFRVLKRFIIHKFRGDETHGVKNTLKFVFNLRKYYHPKVDGYPDKQTTRLKTKNALNPYLKKVIRIKNNKQLNKFLNGLQ
jgi:adenylate kinase family enzyme